MVLHLLQFYFPTRNPVVCARGMREMLIENGFLHLVCHSSIYCLLYLLVLNGMFTYANTCHLYFELQMNCVFIVIVMNRIVIEEFVFGSNRNRHVADVLLLYSKRFSNQVSSVPFKSDFSFQ